MIGGTVIGGIGSGIGMAGVVAVVEDEVPVALEA